MPSASHGSSRSAVVPGLLCDNLLVRYSLNFYFNEMFSAFRMNANLKNDLLCCFSSFKSILSNMAMLGLKDIGKTELNWTLEINQ